MAASADPPVLLESEDRVAVLTLNRPQRGNVLDAAMAEALACAVEALQARVSEGAVRCVLLRGSGAHFCVGGDIREFVAAGEDLPALLDAGVARMHRTVLALAQLPVPVVSAVNGSLGGGGIGLALCADLVLAGESMKLRSGYSAIGLTPDLGVSWALTRLAGPMRARLILLGNQVWSARQCLEAGLVAQVHADGSLDAAARALARSLSQGAAGAQARIKRLVEVAGVNSLEAQLAQEHQAMVEAGGTANAGEGVRAFLEKRKARFN